MVEDARGALFNALHQCFRGAPGSSVWEQVRPRHQAPRKWREFQRGCVHCPVRFQHKQGARPGQDGQYSQTCDVEDAREARPRQHPDA